MTTSRKVVPRTLAGLAAHLADDLDKIMQNSANSSAVSRGIDVLAEEWASSGGAEEGAALLRKARGHAGMINSSRESDRVYQHSVAQLTEFKQALRNVARGG